MEWKMNIFTFLNTKHVSGSELCIVIASCIFFFKLTHIISIQLHNNQGKEVTLFPMIEIRKLMSTLKME